MKFDANHFRLLRDAKARRLRAEEISPGVWQVSSFSRRGHWHKVVGGICSCEATVPCTHLALVTHLQLASDPDYRKAYADDMVRELKKGLVYRSDRRAHMSGKRAFEKGLEWMDCPYTYRRGEDNSKYFGWHEGFDEASCQVGAA